MWRTSIINSEKNLGHENDNCMKFTFYLLVFWYYDASLRNSWEASLFAKVKDFNYLGAEKESKLDTVHVSLFPWTFYGHGNVDVNSQAFQTLLCHTLMPTPASPLSQIKMTAGGSHPKMTGIVACVCGQAIASSSSSSWVSCCHTGNAFHVFASLSWHDRECSLDSEAKCNNSLSSCLYSWCSYVYATEKFGVCACDCPKFCHPLFLPVATRNRGPTSLC